MPQTPTEEWLEELDITEEEYMANLHRLGNLTLAAKPDNSKMSNQLWNYKNEILKSTAHLKMNMELLSIPKWTIENINIRTKNLIQCICKVLPYPEVSLSSATPIGVIDEKKALNATVEYMFSSATEIRKNKVYVMDNNTKGYILLSSKMYDDNDKEKFWFGYRISRFELIDHCKEQFCVFICRNKSTLIIKIPRAFLDGLVDRFRYSLDADGNISLESAANSSSSSLQKTCFQRHLPNFSTHSSKKINSQFDKSAFP